MTTKKITLTDVRQSIGKHVRAHYTVRWFGRPIGNLLTPAFYNTGWSANGVTGVRTLLSLAAVAVLCAGRYDLAVLSVSLYVLVFILDCVDGNLARLSTSVTYWGKFIDGLSDMVYPFFAPLAAGIGVWVQSDDATFILIGGACGTTSMLSQLVRNRLSFMREWMVSQGGPLDTETLGRVAGIQRVQGFVAAVYVNASFFAPALLLVPNQGPILFILAMVIAQLIPEVIWLVASMLEGRILLSRSRRSVHEPTEEELAERLAAKRGSAGDATQDGGIEPDVPQPRDI